MLSAIKSDLRKLLTIRSTYILSTLAILLTSGVAFYFQGFKAKATDLDATALGALLDSSAGYTVIFVTIIGILFMAHEYRYNTIMYTVTANASRVKVFLSKLITISLFSTLFALLISGFTLASYMIGISLGDATLPAQNFDALSQIGRVIFYFVAYGIIGVLLASLIRNLVGTIAFFFIVPSSIEPLLSAFVLKGDKSEYLPFYALDSVANTGMSVMNQTPKLSTTDSMLLVILYLVISGTVAGLLFLKRDTN